MSSKAISLVMAPVVAMAFNMAKPAFSQETNTSSSPAGTHTVRQDGVEHRGIPNGRCVMTVADLYVEIAKCETEHTNPKDREGCKYFPQAAIEAIQAAIDTGTYVVSTRALTSCDNRPSND